MKKLIFFILTYSLISCQNNEDSKSVATDKTINTSTTNKQISSTKHYKNQQFGIEVTYPDDWVAIEKKHPTNETAINILPDETQQKTEYPLSVHGDVELSFISIWPEGFGTEFPSGASKTFQEAQPALPLGFNVKKDESLVFLLDDGTPWAYFIKPASYPKEWTDGGFIFAQIKVNNSKITCFDKESGTEKDMLKCDPLTGDKVVKRGIIDKNEKQIIHHILKELKLKH